MTRRKFLTQQLEKYGFDNMIDCILILKSLEKKDIYDIYLIEERMWKKARYERDQNISHSFGKWRGGVGDFKNSYAYNASSWDFLETYQKQLMVCIKFFKGTRKFKNRLKIAEEEEEKERKETRRPAVEIAKKYAIAEEKWTIIPDDQLDNFFKDRGLLSYEEKKFLYVTKNQCRERIEVQLKTKTKEKYITKKWWEAMLVK